MILFFDTETTGKANFRLPPEAPTQPRIVQLAALMLNSDWTEAASINLIIKPEGFTIPDEAAAIHGITQGIALESGVCIDTALWTFVELALCVEQLVAHNFDFDRHLVTGEISRRKESPKAEAVKTKLDTLGFCTMRAMTPVCKIPGNYSDFKWPKLQEAHKHCYGTGFDDAHDAMADVRACAQVYRWLKEREAQPA